VNAVVLLAVFATPVAVGTVLGAWSYWWPRHQLDRLFAERRRERVAVARLPHIPEPLPELTPVALVVTR
jgi:predicted alpha-1,6-mannanase (GH76 family)